jgi:hypothetical protein
MRRSARLTSGIFAESAASDLFVRSNLQRFDEHSHVRDTNIEIGGRSESYVVAIVSAASPRILLNNVWFYDF